MKESTFHDTPIPNSAHLQVPDAASEGSREACPAASPASRPEPSSLASSGASSDAIHETSCPASLSADSCYGPEHSSRNVPKLRFPEFSGEWEKWALGELASFSKGCGISKEQLSEHGQLCILYGELYTKYKSEIISNVISRTEIDAHSLVRSKANDVIIPSSGESAEEIAIARCVINDNILLGGDLNIIRLHSDNGAFMSYQLNGKRKYAIAKVAQGVSVVHLYGENLKRLHVYTPSINEQVKITRLLSLIDERITTQIQIIEDLKKLRCAIQNYLWHIPGRVTACSQILSEKTEKSVSLNQYETLSSTINGIYLQRDYFSRDIASENTIGYKVVHFGDVVLSPQNLWMGNINFNDKYESGIVSPSYKIYSINDNYNKYYISAILKSRKALYNYMLVSEQGASIVRRNLNLEQFGQISFSIPSADIQEIIGRLYKAISQSIFLSEKLHILYSRQKAYLLSQMFI